MHGNGTYRKTAALFESEARSFHKHMLFPISAITTHLPYQLQSWLVHHILVHPRVDKLGSSIGLKPVLHG